MFFQTALRDWKFIRMAGRTRRGSRRTKRRATKCRLGFSPGLRAFPYPARGHLSLHPVPKELATNRRSVDVCRDGAPVGARRCELAGVGSLAKRSRITIQ